MTKARLVRPIPSRRNEVVRVLDLGGGKERGIWVPGKLITQRDQRFLLDLAKDLLHRTLVVEIPVYRVSGE